MKAVVVLAALTLGLGGCISIRCNNWAKAAKDVAFSAEAGKAFDASTVTGVIEVSGVNEPVFKATAHVEVRTSSQEKADEYLQKVEVRFERSNDVIRAVVDRNGVPKHVPISVSYNVTTAAQTDLRLDTVNGGIKFNAMTGSADARTVNGSIKGEQMGGNVKASTVNGSINLGYAADAKASSINGSTVNGSVTLNMPGAFGGSVSMHTVNGGIHSDVAVVVKGQLGKNVNATIGTGNGNINLSTVNGSIRLGMAQ